MPEKKVKIVTLYVENKGRGKVSIADSAISVRDFPAFTPERKQTIGVNATKVTMPEDHIPAFEGMIKVRHASQLNTMTADEYKDVKEGKAKSKVEQETEKALKELGLENELYEAAMKGGDIEILAYLESFPKDSGRHNAEVQDRSAFVDAKAGNTKESYEKYLKDYPNGIYVADIKQTLGAN